MAFRAESFFGGKIDDNEDNDHNDDCISSCMFIVHYQHCFYSRAESFFGGKVDVLVNNAGVSPLLPFDTVMKVCLHISNRHEGLFAYLQSSKDICSCFLQSRAKNSGALITTYTNQVNLDGVLHGAKLFAEKQSIEPGVGGPGGLVVNTASLAGILYGMDKNRCLASEIVAYG